MDLIGWIDFEDFSIYIKLVPLGVVVTGALHFFARKRAKIDLAIKLYEEFVSDNFYTKVRASAYRVRLQWTHLPEEIRDDYRKVVMSGWVSDVREDKIQKYLKDYPTDNSQIEKYHFQTQIEAKALTEHQALTSLLKFWTRLSIFLKTNSIDKKLTKELFSDEFHYGEAFLKELSKQVKCQALKPPKWIGEIDFLVYFFDSK